MKSIKVWIGSFIIVSLVDYLWHSVIFASFYSKALADAAYMTAGKVAPLLPFLVVGDLVLTIILVMALADQGKAMMKGAVVGLLVIAHLAIVNHALIPGWDVSIIVADAIFGLVAGLLTGIYIDWAGKKSGQSPAQM